MVWYWYGIGMGWCGMVWCGMVWCGMVWYGMVCMYMYVYIHSKTYLNNTQMYKHQTCGYCLLIHCLTLSAAGQMHCDPGGTVGDGPGFSEWRLVIFGTSGSPICYRYTRYIQYVYIYKYIYTFKMYITISGHTHTYMHLCMFQHVAWS